MWCAFCKTATSRMEIIVKATRENSLWMLSSLGIAWQETAGMCLRTAQTCAQSKVQGANVRSTRTTTTLPVQMALRALVKSIQLPQEQQEQQEHTKQTIPSVALLEPRMTLQWLRAANTPRDATCS